MTLSEVREQKIVILSHYGATGACEELRDWLMGIGVRNMVYVSFPFSVNEDRYMRVTRVCRGEVHETRVRRARVPEPIAYVLDFVFAFLFAVKYGRHADVLVAGDNLLTLAGLFAKPFVGIRRVVFYMIDFTPVRFKNPLMNGIYNVIDRLAAYGAHEVWPLTAAMIQARADVGRLALCHVKWRVVPYGSHECGTTVAEEFRRERVVYLGEVARSKGAELLVPMAAALRKLVPQITMSIIGGGPGLEMLRQEVARAGLQDSFEIHGFVENMTEALSLLRSAGVAIAPYDPFDDNSFTRFADPGKLKLYLGCGLPIVLTAVPAFAQRIQAEGAGRIAEYDACDFSRRIAEIISSNDYNSIRESARMLGGAYAWPKVFEDAFAGIVDEHGDVAHE